MLKIMAPLIFSIFTSFYAWGDVLDTDGNPHSEVINIYRKFQPNLGPNPSLEELNEIGQKKFLRPARSERLSKEAIEHYQRLCVPLSPQEQQDILKLFREIGDVETVYPLHEDPNYILIQGS